MAKVTIEITDQPDGTVKVVATPNFMEIAQMEASGHKLTSAHGYAMFALNKIREESKRRGPIGIIIPKVGR